MNAQAQNKTTKVTANFGGKGWLLMIFAFACIFIDSSLLNDSLNITREVFAASTGMNYGVLSIASTVGGWVAVLGGIFWGYLGAKKSARFAWTCSLAVTAIACFVWGSASNYVVYFICVSVAMVGGMGFCYISNGNVIGNWFPKKKGLVMGWITIGFPLSAAVTTALASILAGMGGTRMVYGFYGVVCAILAVLCGVFVRDYPEQAGAFPDNDHSYDKAQVQADLQQGLEYMKTSPWTSRKMLSYKRTWLIGISLGVMELLSLGIMTNFFARMASIGYQPGEIIGMLAIAGIAACFGSPLCGVLDAKVGPKKAIIITFGIGIISLCLNLTGVRPCIYLSLPFLAVMLGGASNYLVSIASTIWGRYDFPMAFKVLKPIVAAIGALGVSLVAIIGENASYGAAYAVLAVMALVAAMIMGFTKDDFVGRN